MDGIFLSLSLSLSRFGTHCLHCCEFMCAPGLLCPERVSLWSLNTAASEDFSAPSITVMPDLGRRFDMDIPFRAKYFIDSYSLSLDELWVSANHYLLAKWSPEKNSYLSDTSWEWETSFSSLATSWTHLNQFIKTKPSKAGSFNYGHCNCAGSHPTSHMVAV